MDVDQVIPARPRCHLLDHDRDRVRQLVAHPLKHRLADQLGDKLLFGLVGELTVRVQRPAGRQMRYQEVGQYVELVAGQG